MFFLHIYWFIMFFKIIGRFIFEGEADDLQQKVENEATPDGHKK